jgi:hypothetical protein
LLDVVARQMKNTVDCLIGYSVVATIDVPRLQKKEQLQKKAKLLGCLEYDSKPG